MAPVISIIIPAYNEEKAIEKTVRQFAALRTPHEVIVSVSPSTDRTAEVAKGCADKVVILPPGGKSGVSPARNDGVAVADGEFLVFIDSDTYIGDANAFFGRLLERFAENKQVVGISVRINVAPAVATWSDRAVSFMMNAWFFFLNKCLGVGIASGKFIIVRAEAFRRTGGFNEEMKTAEDVDLFRHLRRFGLTRIAWELQVHHEGRRFHKLGAWRTFFRWIGNGISYWMFGRSSDSWEPVR
jgi:glycosyltransferase involved in cell wall biosynthesis